MLGLATLASVAPLLRPEFAKSNSREFYSSRYLTEICFSTPSPSFDRSRSPTRLLLRARVTIFSSLSLAVILDPENYELRARTSLTSRAVPRPAFGSATLVPRRAVSRRLPNLVEGNGAPEHRDLALLGELTQQRLLTLLLSPYGLCERKGGL